MTDTDVRLRGVTKRFGAFLAVNSIDLDIRRGQFVTLLGPSGCGKTTTLRMIGGFEYPDEGLVEVGGEPVDGSSSRRHTRMVFQNYALFPHMRVIENVSFGLEMERKPPAVIKKACCEIIQKLGLEGHEHKYPNQISGGQQQRVALARALVTRPRVLLLDEPLGALDLKMRKKMQVELKRLQREVGITFIYVTHDQEEAMNLSDLVVVLDKGRIVQTGTPEEIYRSPSTPYVADFIGETNLLDGVVRGIEGDFARVETSLGLISARLSQGASVAHGMKVVIAIRPESLILGEASLECVRSLEGQVHERLFRGAATRVAFDCGAIRLIADHRGALRVAEGDTIRFGWRAEDAIILVSETPPDNVR